jgi:hypothetical protein
VLTAVQEGSLCTHVSLHEVGGTDTQGWLRSIAVEARAHGQATPTRLRSVPQRGRVPLQLLVLHMWHRWAGVARCARNGQGMPVYACPRLLEWDNWAQRHINRYAAEACVLEQRRYSASHRRLIQEKARSFARNALVGRTFRSWLQVVRYACRSYCRSATHPHCELQPRRPPGSAKQRRNGCESFRQGRVPLCPAFHQHKVGAVQEAERRCFSVWGALARSRGHRLRNRERYFRYELELRWLLHTSTVVIQVSQGVARVGRAKAPLKAAEKHGQP